MMLRRSIIVLLAAVLAGAGAASFLSGCGSAPPGEYESEVARLLGEAAEAREELAHRLAEEDHATEQERVQASAEALEEAAAVTDGIIAALERVKVPGGREEEHRALLESLASERALYESLVSTLEPGEEHGGEETGGHGEAGEEVEEEVHGDDEGDGTHQEEVPQGEEEEPGQGEEPAEGGH